MYPEFYVLKVNDFNEVAKTPLEEWIYYLNTGDIPETASATGLNEVRERLKIDSMSKGEKDAYYRHLDHIVILQDNILTERAEAYKENARSMKSLIRTLLEIIGRKCKWPNNTSRNIRTRC